MCHSNRAVREGGLPALLNTEVRDLIGNEGSAMKGERSILCNVDVHLVAPAAYRTMQTLATWSPLVDKDVIGNVLAAAAGFPGQNRVPVLQHCRAMQLAAAISALV